MLLDAVARVAGSGAVAAHDVEQLAVAVSRPLRVAEKLGPPPAGAAYFTDLVASCLVEDLGKDLGSLVLVDQFEPRTRLQPSNEPGMRSIDLGGHMGRGPAVAEASIDHTLGREQRGHRLAAASVLVELTAHEGGEQTSAAVGREHTDSRDARRMHLGEAGERQSHVPVAGGGNDAPVLEGGERVPRPVPLGLDLHLLVADLDPEGDVLGPEVVRPLLGRDRPDLDVAHERSL